MSPVQVAGDFNYDKDNLLQPGKLFSDSVTSFATTIAVFIFGALSTIIIARALGPAGKGAYSLLILVPTFLVRFGNMGVGTSIVYYIGRRHKLEDLVAASLSLALTLGVSLLVGFPIFYFASRASLLPGLDPFLVLAAISVIPFSLTTLYSQMILLGIGRVKEYGLVTIIGGAVSALLFFWILVVFRWDLAGAMVVYMASAVGMCLVFLWRVGRVSKIRLAWDFRLIRQLVSFGIKGHIGTFTGFLLYRLDMVLVNFYLGSLFVGYYSVGVSLAEMLLYLPNSLGIILLPRTSSLPPAKSREIISMMARNTIFIVMVGALVFAAFARWIIFYLYGEDFLPALTPSLILLPGIIALTGSKIFVTYTTGQGRPLIGTYSAIASLIVNVALNIVFIPLWGIAGAALASTIAYGLDFLIILVAFLYLSKCSLGEALLPGRQDLKLYLGTFSRVRAKLLFTK